MNTKIIIFSVLAVLFMLLTAVMLQMGECCFAVVTSSLSGLYMLSAIGLAIYEIWHNSKICYLEQTLTDVKTQISDTKKDVEKLQKETPDPKSQKKSDSVKGLQTQNEKLTNLNKQLSEHLSTLNKMESKLAEIQEWMQKNAQA